MSPPSPTPFQVASLVNPPIYPNAIVWSDDNLIAVATGDIVTILNPENPQGPRGVITVTNGKPFQIGVIDRADLLSGCLLPTILSRDRQPCVRSLSWSPVGFTPSNGCLLAVCSAEGRVKLYREPHCEFQAEWIEVLDISDLLHGYYLKIGYGEPQPSVSVALNGSATEVCAENLAASDTTNIPSTMEKKRKRVEVVKPVLDSVVFPSSLMQEGSPVEVFIMDCGCHIWRAGRLISLEESRALVEFCEADGCGEQHWIELNSNIHVRNQPNLHSVPTATWGCILPQIRPSMNIAHLPEQILSVKHSISEFLKAGQVIEAWTRDRWLEGFFVGFADGHLLVKFRDDAEAVSLYPTDVRFQPLWNTEEKSWNITVVRLLHPQESLEMVMNKSSEAETSKSSPSVASLKHKRSSTKKIPTNHTDQITAHQYATRSSLLTGLVVAWSPLLGLSANSCDSLCLLAVGSKSGTISIWKVHRPVYYSVDHLDDPVHMVFVGALHAHRAWVTALSFGLLDSTSSQQVLLASGCSDGSASIWVAHLSDFERSSEPTQNPFSLYKEVTSHDNSIVSALSLCIPVQFPQRFLVAVGKGSGSLEVWMFNIKTKSSKKVGLCHAHVQAVTGLAWAFDGRCLYSCSQDNSFHGWIHHKGSLSEVSIPPNNLGARSSSDLPSVSDSSYGVAVSPGNLALAVARRFDAGQLDHMYQKRTQRAGVEFFWIGGQEVNLSPQFNLGLDFDLSPSFSREELVSWGSKMLWSLNQYESCSKQLVCWDVLAAGLAFKQCVPGFMKHVILHWLTLLLKHDVDLCTEDIFSNLLRHRSTLSSRQLHLLNILCRRLMLSSGAKIIKGFSKTQNNAESLNMEEEEKWVNVFSDSEKELRERLVGLSLSAITVVCHSAPQIESGLWKPVGIAQMMKWVVLNQDNVHHQLELILAEVERLDVRSNSVSEYMEEERCCYCSAAVPFGSPEGALCEGVLYSEGEAPQKHKLARCAVSMQVCPLTPLWFCMCCTRRALSLPPNQLFSMVDYPPDFMSFIKPVVSNLHPKPLCPFCGISLQRLQPDFLLSKSPI